MAVHLVVQADVVAGVYEVGVVGAYAAGEGNGLVEGLVRVVWLLPQSVNYEYVGAGEVGQLLVGDGLHVGNVGQGR